MARREIRSTAALRAADGNGAIGIGDINRDEKRKKRKNRKNRENREKFVMIAFARLSGARL